jgi:2-iminobutanoate/2-iminopropanoate deaminase
MQKAITRKAVSTRQAPQAIGPYSQGIRTNGLIFVSGQAGLDPNTQELVEGGVAEQTAQVLKNVDSILKAAGSGLDKVVRCGVFMKDLQEFETMNRVYAEFFPGVPPARTTIQAARLPKDCLVEIDAIALGE